jgi:hypothetical protein
MLLSSFLKCFSIFIFSNSFYFKRFLSYCTFTSYLSGSFQIMFLSIALFLFLLFLITLIGLLHCTFVAYLLLSVISVKVIKCIRILWSRIVFRIEGITYAEFFGNVHFLETNIK